MRKLLVSLLAVSSTAAFAANNSLFQEFDNQVSIGYGMNQTTSTYGTAPGVNGNLISSGNMVTLDGERLFNDGIWVNVNANMAFGAGPTNNPYINNTYGINGKVGYAFPLAGQHLQIIPYAMAGLNNTASTFFPEAGATASGVTANNFAYTGGVGGRIEYRINRTIELYADQNAAYNWDQSGPQFGIQPQNFLSYTSTLGAKFNLAKNFQLGVQGFYTGYDNQASNTCGGCFGYAAQPSSSIGGLVSVGLTY